jgi:putative spermidine/putrescine transport system substrate-binding protein
MLDRKLGLLGSLALGSVLVASACSSGGASTAPSVAPSVAASEAPSAAPSAAASPSADANACTIVPFGPINRCENFYDVAWPKINAALDALYTEAKATDGGQLVIWDWYEQSPDTVKAFNARFPDIKVKSQGFTYNTSSAIITAKAQGKRNSDIVSGSITSMTAMYDQGFWAKVDWTQYGVPADFFNIGNPEMLPDSVNGPLMHYDSAKTPTVPTDLTGYTDPAWKGKLGVASYNAQNFSGYGMKNGQDAMTKLIGDLLANKMVVSDKADDLLSSGDLNAVSAGQLYYAASDTSAVATTTDQPMYLQFSGVNSDAKNPAAAKLWILWNAYDPAWLKLRLTDDKFNSTSEPFPGLPSSLFATTTGLMKINQDAWFGAIQAGTTIFETMTNRDEYNAMIDAANKAFPSQ